jgi:hypothetical protein
VNKNAGFMRYYQVLNILWFFFTLNLSGSMEAQSWNFIKDKDGIKIYARQEAGKVLKSFKGVADINAPAEKIFTMMEDINDTKWWDKSLTQIKVLLYEKNKRAKYYMVYDLPWPLIDRDLYVDVTIKIDTVTGEYKITAVSVPGVIPESSDMVRIKEYRQTWTITPVSTEISHVELEGFIDPAGSIPDWISNMLIVDSPLNSILGVRKQMGGK